MVEKLQAQLKDRAAQYDALQKRFEEQGSKMAADRIAWQQKVDGFEKQFADIGMQHKYAAEDTARLQDELAQSRQRLADLRVQVTTSEQQKEEVLAQDRENKILIGQLQSQLDQTRQRTALLEGQMMSVAIQKDDMAARLDSRNRQNKVLQSTLSQKGTDISAIQNELAATEPAAGGDDDSLVGYGKRHNSFLPDVAPLASAVPAAVRRSPPKLNIPVASAARAPYIASDDWETVVVQ
jgi:chromosome segregation ATPase